MKQLTQGIFVGACMFLGGCEQRQFDRGLERLFDTLMGISSQQIVLAEAPLTIGPEPVSFKSNEPMKVLGEDSAVCLVLKSGIDIGSREAMEKHFQEGLGSANLTGALKVAGGKELELANLGQSWSKYGVITDEEEIAACFSCECGGPKPPVGSEVSEISLGASSPVRVLGVYWTSTNAFDDASKR